MKLYYYQGACSLSPHIVSRELGLDVETIQVCNGKLPDGSDFKQINPLGYVPVLQLDNGQLLTEGGVIVQYLADLKPQAGLIPAAGSFERYRVLEWLGFISTELHKGHTAIFAHLWRGGPEQAAQAARERLGDRYTWLDAQLAGKSFLMGDSFTVADAYLFTVLSWAGQAKIDLAPWKNLLEFQARVGARPKVQQALQEEGLLTPA